MPVRHPSILACLGLAGALLVAWPPVHAEPDPLTLDEAADLLGLPEEAPATAESTPEPDALAEWRDDDADPEADAQAPVPAAPASGLPSDVEDVGTALVLLQENPDEKSFQILMDALDDSDEMIRCEAISSLGNLAHQPAVTKLVALLQHAEAETRKSAALALMKMGDRSALESLNAALAAESDEALKPIMKLAVTQLDKKTAPDDADDWD